MPRPVASKACFSTVVETIPTTSRPHSVTPWTPLSRRGAAALELRTRTTLTKWLSAGRRRASATAEARHLVLCSAASPPTSTSLTCRRPVECWLTGADRTDTERPAFHHRLMPTCAMIRSPSCKRVSGRHLAAAVVVVSLAAVPLEADALRSDTAIDPLWALSPVEAAALVVGGPPDQLRTEVERAARSSARPVTETLLERIDAAARDQLERLAIAGTSTIEAATALIERYDAVRAVLVAQEWGDVPLHFQMAHQTADE